MITKKDATFIDLFAGLGGTRIGFEQACNDLSLESKCVFSSEIKKHAILAYKKNFNNDKVDGDITLIEPDDMPPFDYLLAGFPCQPFSSAGKRHGFLDKRGGLFFTIHAILDRRKPKGFILENVEGLVNHANGKTLKHIETLLSEIGYRVCSEVLDASDFGVAQKRRRVYIVGHKEHNITLKDYIPKYKYVKECIDENYEFSESDFARLLSGKYSQDELFGKSVKDKRGGGNNIHSWDLAIKGVVSEEQKTLLETLLRKRRLKKWAEFKGIKWMDGMPLSLSEIMSFYDHPDLIENLKSLTEMGYLRYEHPKMESIVDGKVVRIPKTDAPKGYNIVTGKLSFPIVKILDPEDFCPTIVATEAGKIAIATDKGVRPLTVTEGLRLSGFPSEYDLSNLTYKQSFDLLGNTVMPPVIRFVSSRLLREN